MYDKFSLETNYPSLIASDETQGTTNYIIPQQSSLQLLYMIDAQGNINTFYPTDVFGGIFGNYSNYYEDRQISEFYTACSKYYQNCGYSGIRTNNPEIFYGTNNILYKHVYYIAIYNSDDEIGINHIQEDQLTEIGDIKWKTLNECLNLFRPYHEQKKNVLYSLDTFLQNK
jgi:hypothetical protein